MLKCCFKCHLFYLNAITVHTIVFNKYENISSKLVTTFLFIFRAVMIDTYTVPILPINSHLSSSTVKCFLKCFNSLNGLVDGYVNVLMQIIGFCYGSLCRSLLKVGGNFDLGRVQLWGLMILSSNMGRD